MTLPLKEWQLQAAAVTALRRARDNGLPIRVAGDMNAGRRSIRERGLAVATGLNPGEPDLRVYLPNGRLLLIEFKRPGGRLSKDQKDAHAELANLGHNVITLIPADEEEAAILSVDAALARLPANHNMSYEQLTKHAISGKK